jgi:transcription-repair coupling factor (superfamily II helicase)
MQLYRRLSNLRSEEELEGFAGEMIDRFGAMPEEVELLMRLVSIKMLCIRAHVDKVDAGPKGVIIGFRDNSFANPAGLVRYVHEQGPEAKVRPDMRVVFIRDFDTVKERLEGTRLIMRTLVNIAEKKKVA